MKDDVLKVKKKPKIKDILKIDAKRKVSARHNY